MVALLSANGGATVANSARGRRYCQYNRPCGAQGPRPGTVSNALQRRVAIHSRCVVGDMPRIGMEHFVDAAYQQAQQIF